MMRRFLWLAAGFYLLSISLGFLLRLVFVQPLGGWLVFGNALHAHSHTLYFGWAGLALCALWFENVGVTGRAERGGLWALVALSLATFTAFLHSGYKRPGVIVMVMAVFIWIYLGVLLWRAIRGAPPDVRFVLRLAVAYLAFAFAGALTRAAFIVAKVDDPVLPALAVYAFVHSFAWFLFLGASAWLVGRAERFGLRFGGRLWRWALWMVAATAWLTFPLGVAGAQYGALGAVARVASVGVGAGMIAWGVAVWRAAAPARVFRWLSLWALLHAAGSFAGTYGLAPLATAVRQPLILYLHVFLVGVVTTTLFAQVAPQLERRGLSPWLHHGGLLVMVTGLALAGAPAFVPKAGLGLGVVSAGFWTALAGAAVLLTAAIVGLAARPARSSPRAPA